MYNSQWCLYHLILYNQKAALGSLNLTSDNDRLRERWFSFILKAQGSILIDSMRSRDVWQARRSFWPTGTHLHPNLSACLPGMLVRPYHSQNSRMRPPTMSAANMKRHINSSSNPAKSPVSTFDSLTRPPPLLLYSFPVAAPTTLWSVYF